MSITKIKDLDILIMDKLDDQALGKVCQIDQKAKSICDNDLFWKRRIQLIFKDKADEVLSSKFENETYRQFYTSKRFQNYKNKIYPLCVEIQRLPHRSQLVIDDLYTNNGILRNMIDLGVHDDYFDFIIIKLAYNKLLKENNIKEAEKYKDLMNKLKPNLFEAYGISEEENLQEQDMEYLQIVLDEEITRINLLKSLGKTHPEFLKSLKNPAESMKIITTIHNGFKTRRIPLDITWNEICTFPHLLNELVF